MDHPPQPARRRADEALLEVAANHLKQEAAAINEIPEELTAWKVHRGW